jgi:hypothetical protein
LFSAEPGTTVRYEKNGLPVRETSAVYTKASPPLASVSTTPPVTSIALRAFRADGMTSPELRFDFIPTSSGFFVNVSERLLADAQSLTFPGYQDLTLRESTTDTLHYPDGYMPASSERFRLDVPESAYYRLRTADAVTDTSYSARIRISMVERDNISEVPDSSGKKVSALAASAFPDIALWLQAGTYYLIVEDIDGLSGRSFGLRVSRY